VSFSTLPAPPPLLRFGVSPTKTSTLPPPPPLWRASKAPSPPKQGQWIHLLPASPSLTPLPSPKDQHQSQPIPVHVSSTLSDRHRSKASGVSLSNLIHIVTLSSDTVPSQRNVKVGLFNCQSIGTREKRAAVSHFVSDSNLDIMFLTETWLKSHGDEAKCVDATPQGFTLKSFPRSTRGGGLAFLYMSSLQPFITISDSFPFSHKSFELAVLILTLQSADIHFHLLYRPPPNKRNQLSDSLFMEEFQELLDTCNCRRGKYIFLGDFNFHFDSDAHSARVKDLATQYDLTQTVSEATHRSGHIIDWVLHRESDQLVQSTCVSLDLSSDHYTVMCELNVTKPKCAPAATVRRNIRAIDRNKFRSDIKRVLSEHPDLTVSFFNSELRALLDKHAPATKCTLRPSKSEPWFTPEVTSAKKERRKAERAFRKSGLTVHSEIYKAKRSAATYAVLKAKTDFYSAKVLESDTSKKLFSVTNRLLGKPSASPLPTNIPALELPNAFSEFFTSKIVHIRQALDSMNPTHIPTTPPLVETPLACFQPVSESAVLDIIKRSPPKSCSLDPIPTTLLLECIEELLTPLTTIINHSLETGIFPSEFKTAVVKPLIKKTSLDPNQLKNYRPVSNLSFVSKILEKTVLKQLSAHLQANNLMHPLQSAYRVGHSTETALVRVVSDLLTAADNSQVSALVLLDLSAAFDTVDHNIMLHRLENYFGLAGTALHWFRSYLTSRKQLISVFDIQSNLAHLEFGVPQGSVLGPMLFTLYTQPLSQIFSKHSVNHHMYADDTQLQKSSPPSEIALAIVGIESCVNDVSNWMAENKLQLNSGKTEAILNGAKLLNDPPISLSICQAPIVFTDTVRNLGVYLDSDLQMREHVSIVCRAAFLELRRIGTIRHVLSSDATCKLVVSLVLSRLDYCNALLAGLPQSLIQKLQRVQNCAARLVLRVPRREHVTPLLRMLHWLPVEARIIYKISCLCFHAINTSTPSYLSELLHMYCPSRTLRSSSDTCRLRIPVCKYKTKGDRAFCHVGPSTWNSLPLELRTLKDVTSFKSKLKTYLFEKYLA
jgi:exonuclease III